MGSFFNELTYPGQMTREEVKEDFLAYLEQDRYQNGHNYSGTIGMATGLTFVNKSFPNYMDACEWVAYNAQKWEDALAVRYTGEDGEAWFIGAWCSA